jgi:uncharacterized protein YjbJ (UPF0337 family)
MAQLMCHTEQYEPRKSLNVSPKLYRYLQRESEFKLFKRKSIVNKDQVKGTAKDIAGKIEEEAGKVVGSKEHEAKGLGKQISGKAQKKYGDAKEAVKDAVDEI